MKLGTRVKIKSGDAARHSLLNTSFYDPEEIDKLPGLVGEVVGVRPLGDYVLISFPGLPAVYKELYVSIEHLTPA